MIEIKNELISVGINIDGAELEYIKIKGINILWEREDLWMEQSPILKNIIIQFMVLLKEVNLRL